MKPFNSKKLGSSQLRDLPKEQGKYVASALQRNPLYFIVENVYDTYNVGGLFRLADALAVEKLYLCGEMETPPNHKIKKASIGTYKIVPWEYRSSAREAIRELRQNHSGVISTEVNGRERNGEISLKQERSLSGACTERNRSGRDDKGGVQIVAVEQDGRSRPYTEIDYQTPLAILVGNETYGVLPETLKECDHIAEIPMWGINKSLNVIVSTAIVSYWAIEAFHP